MIARVCGAAIASSPEKIASLFSTSGTKVVSLCMKKCTFFLFFLYEHKIGLNEYANYRNLEEKKLLENVN